LQRCETLGKKRSAGQTSGQKESGVGTGLAGGGGRVSLLLGTNRVGWGDHWSGE